VTASRRVGTCSGAAAPHERSPTRSAERQTQPVPTEDVKMEVEHALTSIRADVRHHPVAAPVEPMLARDLGCDLQAAAEQERIAPLRFGQ